MCKKENKWGVFSGRNRDWLFAAFLVCIGFIAMPDPLGALGESIVFPAIIGGMCFGMAAMITYYLVKENGFKPFPVEEKEAESE